LTPSSQEVWKDISPGEDHPAVFEVDNSKKIQWDLAKKERKQACPIEDRRSARWLISSTSTSQRITIHGAY
jgi:hypothetical protein